MRCGIPTLIFLLLLAAALALFAVLLTHQTAQSPAANNPSPYILTSRPIPTNGWGPLHAMSANIRLDDPKDAKNVWLNRRELLRNTLLKYQPDILACQEVSPAQGAYLRRELAPYYSFYPRAGIGSTSRTSAAASASTPASIANGGAADAQLLGAFSDVLSSLNTIFYRTDRFDILDGEAGLVIPSEPQPNAADNTFFTLAVLRERRNPNPAPATPGTLLVIDVHFRHTEAFAVRCANQLHDIIAQWQTRYPHSGILLLGDINFDRTSKLHAALAADPATRPSSQLADAFDYAKLPPGKNGTYHAFTGNPAASLPTDLIFYAGSLTLSTPAEILRDHSPDAQYPSDHFLIHAALQWQSPPPPSTKAP